HSVRQHAVAAARFRIELRSVGKRKNVDGIKKIGPGISVARGLRETNVKASPRACCTLNHQSIKYFSMGFIFVEAIVTICAKQPPALRCAKSYRAFDCAGCNRNLGSGTVFKPE